MLEKTDHTPMKLEKHYTCWIEMDGIYLINPLYQGWLVVSHRPMPEFNLG